MFKSFFDTSVILYIKKLNKIFTASDFIYDLKKNVRVGLGLIALPSGHIGGVFSEAFRKK